MGLVDKGEFDKRTNAYKLTDRSVQLLQDRVEWEEQYLDEVTA